MTIEESKALALAAFRAFNERNLQALDDLYAPEFVDHSPASPDQEPGVAGLRRAWQKLQSAFPAVRAVIEEVIAEGEKVALRITFQETLPGGKTTKIGEAIEIVRIAEGKITDSWNVVHWS